MRGILVREVAGRLGIACESEAQVSGFQIDSRLVQPGDLFFALKGEQTDGHLFLSEVARRGAVSAVVSNIYEGNVEGLTLLRVADVQFSLQELAKQDIALHPVPIVGITGSVGKTTTKEFLATLLEGKMKVGKSPASYNSRVTFPLNLLNRVGEEQALLLEMGMSAPGEIARLVEIAAPDVALITKVALAHAANFPEGLSGIARAKAEIFSHSKTKKIILDAEILQFQEIADRISAEKITFSIQNPAADYYLSFGEGRFRVDERGVRAYQFDLPFKETHLLQDFLAAAVTARQLGAQWEEITARIPQLLSPKMRFEKLDRDGVLFINDAYNANPASMEAALENFPEPKEGGKRIAVLASMKELGTFSQKAHADVGRLAQKRVDMLLCLGEETAPLCEAYGEAKKPVEFCLDHQAIVQKLREMVRPGDVVLLKGSRSMHLERILELLGAYT